LLSTACRSRRTGHLPCRPIRGSAISGAKLLLLSRVAANIAKLSGLLRKP